jgi:CRISPR-associated protein Cmr4
MKKKIYIIQTRSGLHCGIGQGLSDIDLPTAKESVTGYPFIPGSSLKGVLRDHFNDGTDIFRAAFGPDPNNASDHASALSFSDARLVCLPVRSWFGTFAYMASPTSLGLFRRQLPEEGAANLPGLPNFTPVANSYCAALPAGSKLVPADQPGGRVLLEDLDLQVDLSQQAKAGDWAALLAGMLYPGDTDSQTLFTQRFAIVDDDVMAFLCEAGLPVAAHNRIGENGIVVDGALWYEEFVPPEAVFWGAIHAGAGKGDFSQISADTLLDLVCCKPVHCQVGGSATTGRGLVVINFTV